MAKRNEDVYRFADLSEYGFKKRLMIYIADLFFFAAIKIIGSAVRWSDEGNEHLEDIRRSGKLPIHVIWHNHIFLSTYHSRNLGIVVMTSESFDGEYIARFIQRFGFGAIRGSSSRGGSRALVEMIKAMRSGLPMAITADGPRGPLYKAKPGPVLLAQKTGNPMIASVIEPKAFWTVGSWDRMQIPKPFTAARVFFGEPIYVGPDDDIKEKLAEIQRSLDDLGRRGKEWSGRADQLTTPD
ncbi:MAG: lysophospholipid acyltransferase family protein [Pyrinomonadaceae bacterium]